MTYGEIKEQVKDLGFEDTSSMEEYQTVVKNALNMALQHIFDDVVLQLKGYYKVHTDKEWVRPSIITDSTPDEHVIDLPDNVLVLVPLLTGHFVWLDDDVQKSVMYWNDYEDFRQKIIAACLADSRATITGGIGW